ncbi:MAG TPA: VanZ family protein [Ferruginibacter sp.]|nr:VanZ family protein [Ferruginibacter sp.]
MNHQPSEIKDIPVKKFYPGIAWFFLVLILVCIPGYDLPKVDNWLIEINFDKFIHVGIFAVLAWLFMIPVVKSALPVKEKWNWLIKITIASVIWGITTELIQKFFIPGRSFNLTDWAADGLGAIAALLYFKLRRGGIGPKPAK